MSHGLNLKNFGILDNGDVYRTLDYRFTITRKGYSRIHSEIKNGQQLRATLREKYAWPGGYEIVFLTKDGCVLCWECVMQNYSAIISSIRQKCNDGWWVCASDIVEDYTQNGADLVCENCNKTWESEE